MSGWTAGIGSPGHQRSFGSTEGSRVILARQGSPSQSGTKWAPGHSGNWIVGWSRQRASGHQRIRSFGLPACTCHLARQWGNGSPGIGSSGSTGDLGHHCMNSGALGHQAIRIHLACQQHRSHLASRQWLHES
ncbi:unnamed protein product, partial [Staurois parvus]